MIKVIIAAPDFLIINTKKLNDPLYISTSSQFKMPSLILFFLASETEFSSLLKLF